VYHEAHSLALAIYHETRNFPRDEWFGIRSQIRRAAVSTVSNIVGECQDFCVWRRFPIFFHDDDDACGRFYEPACQVTHLVEANSGARETNLQ
jgi:hypothetical protein